MLSYTAYGWQYVVVALAIVPHIVKSRIVMFDRRELLEQLEAAAVPTEGLVMLFGSLATEEGHLV